MNNYRYNFKTQIISVLNFSIDAGWTARVFKSFNIHVMAPYQLFGELTFLAAI
jgi:hypothetical protein